MSLAHQVFEQSVRPMPRSERLRLAALILEDLADDREFADPSNEVEEANARDRAEAITPRSADLERLMASGTRPAVWHDDDESLF
jgi:hypothetical protein